MDWSYLEGVMQCPKCNNENPAAAKFCRECGEKLPTACPKCGNAVTPQDKFCMDCGEKLDGVAPAKSDAPMPKLEDMHAQLQNLIPDELAQKYMSAEQQATGENRPITALFADISGFTPLSNTQSSEFVFQLVQDCFKQLVGVVARYEGSISGFRGDGLLALFGAPILHENDAERAILTALDMRDAMQEQGLGVSIGVNTAMMTVGEIQTQLHSEYTAYGTDINLAKRLQESAQPGQILVGTGTHRLTRRMFDFDMIQSLSVKGFQEPVTAYTVRHVKEHPEKLRGIEGLRVRMIGREHEFTDLKEATDAWLSGHGQISCIIGEAGIGKSRLVSELRNYLASRDNTEQAVSILEGRCVSMGQAVSYWPFIEILRSYFGLSEEDDTYEIVHKITESINSLMPQGAEETLPLLGNLLSIIEFGKELDDRLKFATPEQIRHQTLIRLRDIFRTLAGKRPLLLILEDLHWADDLSLDLISLLMDELASTPLMLLCVYRPEKEHRVWQLNSQARRKCLDRCMEIMLHPLSSHESRLLVESLLEIDNLPEATRSVILDKSEGNPFFIEEVIRSLIEQDAVYREDDRWKARDEIANIHVPDTIQSVVLSRVDRLQSEAKHVLQRASVIGRLFRYRLLRYIYRQEQDLDRYLTEFAEKELVFPERTLPELEYAFKHAFTQEATYEGILEQRRREFHHQVAVGIEHLYKERIAEYYEELAHHYSHSEDAEKAVEYLLKAGEKAKRSYLNDTAISYYQQALDIIEKHGIQNNEWKLEALQSAGKVYFGIGRVAEAKGLFERAIALARDMGLPARQLVRLYFCIAEALFWQSQYDEMLRYGEMGLEILGDDTECTEAALMNTMISLAYQDNEKFREYNHRNLAFIRKLPYSMELRASYIVLVECHAYGDNNLEDARELCKELELLGEQHHDLRAVGESWLRQAKFLEIEGKFVEALQLYAKTFGALQNIGDEKHVGFCCWYISYASLTMGDVEKVETHAQMFLSISEKIGDPRTTGIAHGILGIVAMCQHHWEEAISHHQKGLEALKDAVTESSRISQGQIALALTYLKRKDYHSAITIFQEQPFRRVSITGIEQAYMELGKPEKFIEFYRSLIEKDPESSEKMPSSCWHLEQAEVSEEFPCLIFVDVFGESELEPSWVWVDEFADCSHSMLRAGGLEICSANGRDLYDLNLSAPRLMREMSGDFAVEVTVSPASGEKPQMGGLLVWKDKDNFLRFESGADGQNEMRLHGRIGEKWQFVGRGLLPCDDIHLRLERSGDEFSAYCSTDGDNWLTCGSVILPTEDPIQIGIHAIGMIDRTIYCGAYKEGTATVFRNFRIWTRG